MTERLYLNNPYLRQIDARIVEKVYKNNKYYIKTDKTIFLSKSCWWTAWR